MGPWPDAAVASSHAFPGRKQLPYVPLALGGDKNEKSSSQVKRTLCPSSGKTRGDLRGAVGLAEICLTPSVLPLGAHLPFLTSLSRALT